MNHAALCPRVSLQYLPRFRRLIFRRRQWDIWTKKMPTSLIPFYPLQASLPETPVLRLAIYGVDGL